MRVQAVPVPLSVHPPAPGPPLHAQGMPVLPALNSGASIRRSESSGLVSAIPFSIVSQLDGLAYALLRLRVECDVFAHSLEVSSCKFFGNDARVSWSTFTGIYFGPAGPRGMNAALQRAENEHCIGYFVFAVDAGDPAYEARLATARCVCFFDLLQWAPDGVTVERSRKAVAMLLDFDYKGRLKAKRRPERVFTLSPLAPLDLVGVERIPHVPVLTTRCSATHQFVPEAAADTLRDTGPVHVPQSVSLPAAAAVTWQAATMAAWASAYPFADVGELAIQATSTGVQPFVGELCKSVVPRGSGQGSQGLDMPEAVRLQCRDKFLEDVAQGFTAGPLLFSPYRWYRQCLWFCVRKDKNNPLDARVRLIAHFSKGGAASINGLCMSPRLLGRHIGAGFLRDRIAECGRGALINAWDVPSCFKRQPIAPELLHLFVYRVVTEKFGTEFFADLTNPFGWAPAEWAWQCILAVLMWRFRLAGFHLLLEYVDNFFDVMPVGTDMAPRAVEIEGLFSEVGCPLHEKQKGTSFKGLGWLFHTTTMVMECPELKYRLFADLLRGWASSDQLSLFDIRRAVGFMLCLSAGFEIGRASAAYLIHARTRGDAVFATGGCSPADVIVKLRAAEMAALQFWAAHIPRWNRLCPIVAGFSPVCRYDFLARTDASTEWGGGGWFLPARVATSVRAFQVQWSQRVRGQAFVRHRESTAYLEALAVVELLQAFGAEMAGSRVQLELDNASVVSAIEQLYTPTVALLRIVVQVANLCCRHHITLRVRWVLGVVFNRIADSLSHNQVAQARELCQEEFGIPLLLQ